MHARRPFLVIILALVAVVAIVAAGCGDDATATRPPATATIPPTVVPTQEPTNVPVQDDAMDKDGDAMDKDGDAMDKDGDAMDKDGDAMDKDGDAMMDATGKMLLVALNEDSDSGQSGWALLTAKENDTEVVLSLSEGVMESELVHIHAGSCGPDLGGVEHDLTNFANGASTTLLVGVSLESLLTGSLAINAHNSSDPGVYTACGNIPGKADTLTIALNEDHDSGQSGWATLMARGDDTEVVLSLSEGAMVSELVHIHSGACGPDLGGVEHDLTNFANGASTTLLVGVSLESLLTGSLAINAYNSSDPSVYTACGDIPAVDAMAMDKDGDAMMGDKDSQIITLKDFRFEPDQLQVEAGKKARFTVSSEGAGHTFTVRSLDVDVVLPAGTTETIEFDVPEGTGEIQLVCRFHEAAGMVATLDVT